MLFLSQIVDIYTNTEGCPVIQCQSLQGRIHTHDFLMADDYKIIYEKRTEGI